ncbi:uncharacterized protein LOC132728546 [Ruditapes philippinarum]|uniref:uncharacterized protein LOC132728546 n=1 Tax=Ruditapes philippinarum TaxID=129788 RepID=UPI00295AA5A8|nr:uncharacterized protein LOC132728546 [Ruditapes philippinarum]
MRKPMMTYQVAQQVHQCLVIPDGSTSSSERIQQSRVVKDDGQLRFNDTYITPIRNRPHEDDLPGSPNMFSNVFLFPMEVLRVLKEYSKVDSLEILRKTRWELITMDIYIYFLDIKIWIANIYMYHY